MEVRYSISNFLEWIRKGLEFARAITKKPHSLWVFLFGLGIFKGCYTLLWNHTCNEFWFSQNFQNKPENFSGIFTKAFSQPPCLFFFRNRPLIFLPSKSLEKCSLMKSHIAYGIKFICYSGLDDAAEVTWNIFDDHNVNQFLQNFVLFEKPWLNFFIFLYLIKSICFLQKARLRHSTNKTYSGSTSEESMYFVEQKYKL